MTRRGIDRRALAVVLALVAGVGVPDAPAQPAENEEDAWSVFWLPPSARLDDWVFLLQAYYSGLDGIGAGLEVNRLITVPVLSGLTGAQVEFKAQGRLYEQGHGELELGAETFFAGGRYAAVTRLDHSTRLREFWGVGPDLPDANREEYRPSEMRAYFELLRRFSRWRIGPRVEFHDYKYLRLTDGGLLESGDYPGVTAGGESALGVGITADFDSRDDRYHPSEGWWLEALVARMSRPGSEDPGFWSTFLDVRNFRSITAVDVLALQFFSYGVSGDAPVWRYAALGVGEHSRGYSRNRYLDRRMAAVQAEWRRPLAWRLGMQVFAGVALVTPSWPAARIDTLRPTLGAGLSVRIPAVSDVPIRGDLAMGDGDLHAALSIGFAF